jgi:uncharacterized membrane protein
MAQSNNNQQNTQSQRGRAVTEGYTPMAQSNNNQQDTQSQNSSEDQANQTERWTSLVGGSALVLMGIRQRSLPGALMAVVGGGLIYQGATQRSTVQQAKKALGTKQNIKVEKTVTINKSAEELYRYWRNFENLPTFMKHIKSVNVIDERHSHWVADAPLDKTIEWNAQITDDQPNQLIAWESVEGADVGNSGSVRFQSIPGKRGTAVKLLMELNPPGGATAGGAAKLFGKAPSQQIGNDLHRFKQLMEVGEVVTTEGQPKGSEPRTKKLAQQAQEKTKQKAKEATQSNNNQANESQA